MRTGLHCSISKAIWTARNFYSPGQGTNQVSKGFTLIELMIAVAVIAILAAIAYPSYQDSVRKSRRADAKSSLMELAQFMERTYIENKTYKPGGSAPSLPFTESPKDGTTKFYDLSLPDTKITQSKFTLLATPKGVQADDGKLELDHTGAKRWDKNNNGSFDTGENHWN